MIISMFLLAAFFLLTGLIYGSSVLCIFSAMTVWLIPSIHEMNEDNY